MKYNPSKYNVTKFNVGDRYPIDSGSGRFNDPLSNSLLTELNLVYTSGIEFTSPETELGTLRIENKVPVYGVISIDDTNFYNDVSDFDVEFNNYTKISPSYIEKYPVNLIKGRLLNSQFPSKYLRYNQGTTIVSISNGGTETTSISEFKDEPGFPSPSSLSTILKQEGVEVVASHNQLISAINNADCNIIVILKEDEASYGSLDEVTTINGKYKVIGIGNPILNNVKFLYTGIIEGVTLNITKTANYNLNGDDESFVFGWPKTLNDVVITNVESPWDTSSRDNAPKLIIRAAEDITNFTIDLDSDSVGPDLTCIFNGQNIKGGLIKVRGYIGGCALDGCWNVDGTKIDWISHKELLIKYEETPKDNGLIKGCSGLRNLDIDDYRDIDWDLSTFKWVGNSAPTLPTNTTGTITNSHNRYNCRINFPYGSNNKGNFYVAGGESHALESPIDDIGNLQRGSIYGDIIRGGSEIYYYGVHTSSASVGTDSFYILTTLPESITAGGKYHDSSGDDDLLLITGIEDCTFNAISGSQDSYEISIGDRHRSGSNNLGLYFNVDGPSGGSISNIQIIIKVGVVI